MQDKNTAERLSRLSRQEPSSLKSPRVGGECSAQLQRHGRLALRHLGNPLRTESTNPFVDRGGQRERSPQFVGSVRNLARRTSGPELAELPLVDDTVREQQALLHPNDDDGGSGWGRNVVNGEVDPGVQPPPDDLLQPQLLLVDVG